jgi:hypothetical protein
MDRYMSTACWVTLLFHAFRVEMPETVAKATTAIPTGASRKGGTRWWRLQASKQASTERHQVEIHAGKGYKYRGASLHHGLSCIYM